MKLEMKDHTYEHGKGVTRKFSKSTTLGVVAIILLVLVVASVSARQWYVANLAPLDADSTELVQVNIEEGSSGEQIAKQLEDEEVIRNSIAFRLYGYFQGNQEELQAGIYELSPSMPVDRVTEMLVSGQVATRSITLLSGQSLQEIKAVMIDNGFLPNEIDEAFNGEYSSFVYNLKPENKSLEGYIYPDTYEISNKTTPRELVQTALANFDSKVDDELIQNLKKQGLSFYEGLILASIVHQEVTDFEDRRKVSQVFLTRLDRGMPLGADPTFKYAAKLQNVEPSPNIDSPYNTRKVTGLTPTPIGNVTISTLKALADPTDTDFLYFVSGDDGITRFSKTFEEHESNIQKHCKELCK